MAPKIVTPECVAKWLNDGMKALKNKTIFKDKDPRGEFPDSEMNYLNSFYSFQEQKWKLKYK